MAGKRGVESVYPAFEFPEPTFDVVSHAGLANKPCDAYAGEDGP